MRRFNNSGKNNVLRKSGIVKNLDPEISYQRKSIGRRCLQLILIPLVQVFYFPLRFKMYGIHSYR